MSVCVCVCAGILYNCGRLASGCSSCLGSNEAGYECGWCSGNCSVVEECSDTFSTSTGMCPGPSISSVIPDRGPRGGGTRVTITGSDLGANFSDIEQVTLRLEDGTVVAGCSLNRSAEEENYVSGVRVVCETEGVDQESVGSADDLELLLVVDVRREDSSFLSANISFRVQQPQLTGVDPEFGPRSGGVDVVISGSFLDTGNTEETTVTLNDVNCVISQ